jgi:uncharacterized membrane protein
MQSQVNKLCALAFSLLLGLTFSAPAAGQTYTTIDPPGSVFTGAFGINDAAQIVGRYADAAGINHGFLFSNDSYSSFDVPGASGFTDPVGINSKAQIVGSYLLDNVSHGFLLSGGTFTTIDPPGAHGSGANGINRNGDIVGSYAQNILFSPNTAATNGNGHGYLLKGGVFTTIDFPGATYTEGWRIDDAGNIIGRYQTGDGKYHVYLLSNGTFTSIPDVPGAVQTAFFEVGGFNRNGDIAAAYCSATPCPWGFQGFFKTTGIVHGFLLKGGVYTTIDFPGATASGAFGLDSFDDTVGAYIDTSGVVHGFLRIP